MIAAIGLHLPSAANSLSKALQISDPELMPRFFGERPNDGSPALKHAPRLSLVAHANIDLPEQAMTRGPICLPPRIARSAFVRRSRMARLSRYGFSASGKFPWTTSTCPPCYRTPKVCTAIRTAQNPAIRVNASSPDRVRAVILMALWLTEARQIYFPS